MINKYEKLLIERGYMVSEDGRAYNKNGDEVGFTATNGYKEICVRIKGIPKTIKLHRLQAFQKFGDKLYEDNIVARHLDGNKLNNSWNNIMIGTQSDNMMDVPEQVRIKRSRYATSFTRKYNKEEVKAFHKTSKSYKETMRKFNIKSKGTVHYILNS